MSVQKYSNSAQTTLNNGGSLGAADVTVTVTDGSVFPSTGVFVVKINTELATIASRSGNVLTFAARGVEGTAAAIHVDGSIITSALSAGALLGLSSAIVQAAAYSSIPAAGQEGNLFLPTNGMSLYRDNGSLWVPHFPSHHGKEPIDGDFAWINQGGATTDTTQGGVYLNAPASGADNLRIRKKAAPSTPYTITAAYLPAMIPMGFGGCGLCWRQSSDGKVIVFGTSNNGTTYLASWTQKWTNATTFSATYVMTFENMNWFWRDIVWVRLKDDGTTRFSQVSQDGKTWFTAHSVGRTDFMTADEVGFWSLAPAGLGTQPTAMWLLSWEEA
jgi:hypothetical protein